VASIGSLAFGGCTGLKSVTIPNSVTSIGSSAFGGCTGLTSVTIPNSVTSIGEGVFSGCSLRSISVNQDNTKYDSRDNCNAIIETESNTLIAGNKNTVIPNSVTSIGSYAFEGCTVLTSVTIPNSVTSIGSSAFRRCTGLTSVTIPNSVTSIGGYAFGDCTGLKSVTIPNSVTSIGEYAFKGCTGLTEITIPNSVTSIGSNAFYGCTGLTEITIPNSVTSIGGGVFYGCTGLKSVTIPNSVTSIERSAFYGCTGLKSVTIPNSVTSIGGGVFYGCTGLTEITIPNSVTSIGEYAFKGCTGLKSVFYPHQTIPTNLDFLPTNGVIFVPVNSKDAYVQTFQSRSFSTIFDVNATQTTISVKTSSKVNSPSELKNMQVVVGGKTYNATDNIINIADLTPNKEYELTASIDIGSYRWEETFVAATSDIVISITGNVADVTQTTATLRLKANSSYATITKRTINGVEFEGDEVVMTNLAPNKDYTYTYAVQVGDDYSKSIDVKFKTKDISIARQVTNTTQTTATLRLTANPGDATIAKRTINGEEFDGDEVVLTNLTPNKDYTYTYAVQVGDDYTKSVDIAFRTKDISISGEVTNTTQTTATLHLNAEMGDATLVSSEVGSITVEGEDITLTGLVPNTEYTYEYSVLTDGDYRKSSEITFKTKNITVDFDFTAAATTLEINASYDVGDATLTSASFDAENQVSKIEASGLEPNRTYSCTD